MIFYYVIICTKIAFIELNINSIVCSLKHQSILFCMKAYVHNVCSSLPAVEETGGDSWKYSLRVSKDTHTTHKQTHRNYPVMFSY